MAKAIQYYKVKYKVKIKSKKKKKKHIIKENVELKQGKKGLYRQKPDVTSGIAYQEKNMCR